VVANPTAVQSLEDVHDTPLRLPPLAGLGMLWSDQLVPFQATASVGTVESTRSTTLPTAVQAEAVAHDTPVKDPSPFGLGTV
jgi:hypothetical protein